MTRASRYRIQTCLERLCYKGENVKGQPSLARPSLSPFGRPEVLTCWPLASVIPRHAARQDFMCYQTN